MAGSFGYVLFRFKGIANGAFRAHTLKSVSCYDWILRWRFIGCEIVEISECRALFNCERAAMKCAMGMIVLNYIRFIYIKPAVALIGNAVETMFFLSDYAGMLGGF